jgi:branched-chain amino acid transport system ATP-binding protein
MLALDDVVVSYGAVRAVDGVGMTVGAGEICGLVGPNGSGKTTLLNAISGLIALRSGSITFAEKDLTRSPGYVVARSGVRRTFQLIRLLHGLSVQDNVAAGITLVDAERRPRGGFRAMVSPRRLSAPIQERVDAAMDATGIAEYADVHVDELPFGIQRRVELARAIVAEPRLLLLDEPASGLDERDIAELGDMVNEQARRGCAVVLVDHHLQFVLGLCPRLVVLNFGHKIFDGAADEAVADPQVREAYVGT